MTTEKEKKPRKRKPRIKCDYSVKLYEDGKYHWLYDLHMLKNPAVLFDLFWALGVSTAITVFIIFCIQACSNGINADDLMIVLKIAGILIGIMLVLGVLGYLLYAALSGWIYSVHFIMDENGVEHKAAPRSKKLAKRIGFLTVLVGKSLDEIDEKQYRTNLEALIKQRKSDSEEKREDHSPREELLRIDYFF